jgi:hypothetical protein
VKKTLKNTRRNAILRIYSPSEAETRIYEQTFSDRGNPWANNGLSGPPRGLSKRRRLLIPKQCQLALSGTGVSETPQ